MSASMLLRAGLTGIAAAVAVAFAFRLQQPLGSGVDTSSPAVAVEASTHCYHGVRTHDVDRPAARCFTVRDGLFHGVSTEAETDVPSVVQQVLQNHQGYAIPGLWDGHGHLLHYAEFLHSVDLFGSQSLDEVRGRIRSYVAANPDAGSAQHWIRGVGWDQTPFGRMPTAADIEQDDDLKGVYMMLDRIDVHCIWVSQAVLDLLPADLPDTVPGGEIVRDPGMGVFCDNAMDMVMPLWPRPGRDATALAVKTAIGRLNSLGLVGMHDASTTPDAAALYADMSSSDDWTLRVYGMLECDRRNTYCPEDAATAMQRNDYFTIRSVKLFADGALGSWGSALIEPYTDHPWTSGSLLINASDLADVARAWASDSFQVNIHAIGDLANRNALDAIEAALRQQCPSAGDDPRDLAACQARHRHRIEHAQIIHPDDQRRLHALGVLPSIQPTHATSDMRYAEDRLGPRRTRDEAYRMRSLLPAGALLGSDFPVEPPDPFQGIYAAVARRSPHTGLAPGGDPRGWYPEEALGLDDALWGFTGAVARGAFMEGRAGVIREGAFADWVVLDEPIEDGMDVEKLRDMRVRETWVGGRMVYARDDRQ